MDTAVSEVLIGSIGGDENEHVIEVVAVEEDGRNRYEIRLLSFGEGIGWYVQKTLPLDSNQAKALGRILSKTDTNIERKPIRQEEIPTSRRVIGFPHLNT